LSLLRDGIVLDPVYGVGYPLSLKQKRLFVAELEADRLFVAELEADRLFVAGLEAESFVAERNCVGRFSFLHM
jgi:hypothetical protein